MQVGFNEAEAKTLSLNKPDVAPRNAGEQPDGLHASRISGCVLVMAPVVGARMPMTLLAAWRHHRRCIEQTARY